MLTFDFVTKRAQKTMQVMDHKKFQVMAWLSRVRLDGWGAVARGRSVDAQPHLCSCSS